MYIYLQMRVLVSNVSSTYCSMFIIYHYFGNMFGLGEGDLTYVRFKKASESEYAERR